MNGPSPNVPSALPTHNGQNPPNNAQQYALKRAAKSVGVVFLRFISAIFPFHARAFKAEAIPIVALLRATELANQAAQGANQNVARGANQNANNDPSQKANVLAAKLLAASQSQLNFIAVTGALVAGVVATSFTWPDMAHSTWTTKALFYTSLVLALGSAGTATQQAVALSRVGSGPNEAQSISKLFIKGLDEDGNLPQQTPYRPGAWQLYVWQLPISMLGLSLYFFVSGLAVLIWNVGHSVELSPSKGETKVVISFMVALAFVVFRYAASGITLYSRVR